MVVTARAKHLYARAQFIPPVIQAKAKELTMTRVKTFGPVTTISATMLLVPILNYRIRAVIFYSDRSVCLKHGLRVKPADPINDLRRVNALQKNAA